MAGSKGVPGTEIDILADQHFPIPALTFKDGERLEQTLYFLHEGNYVPFEEQGKNWKTDNVDKLKATGTSVLYTKFHTPSAWHAFIDAKMPKILSNPNIKLNDKARVVYAASVSSATDFFANPKSTLAAEQVINFVKHCVTFLNQDAKAFHEIFSVSAQDMTEHNHGLHVSAYAVTLAKALGHTDPDDLLSLAIGAAIHDIGKTKISWDVLHKPGALSPEEVELVRKHPRFGFDIAKTFAFIPNLARQIVHEHHERIDGSGYPRAMTDVHIFSQIVGLCDVFDSMTSHRPYKKQSNSMDSLVELLKMNKGGFDRNLIIAFIEMMKK